MEHVRGVDVLEAAEGLVDKRLEVRVGERLLRADLRVRARELRGGAEWLERRTMAWRSASMSSS